jgi:hypothetical protein
MYKTLFQNSKAAMFFAAATVIGAVVMIGSPEDKGVLNKAVDEFSEQRETFVEGAQAFAESQSVADEPIDPEAGWGSSSAPVFGEYSPAETELPGFYDPPPQPAGSSSSKAQSQPTARIPGPQPVIADSEGIPLSSVGGASAPSGQAVITSRKTTIEPN